VFGRGRRETSVGAGVGRERSEKLEEVEGKGEFFFFFSPLATLLALVFPSTAFAASPKSKPAWLSASLLDRQSHATSLP
jgi:hypothetical protein